MSEQVSAGGNSFGALLFLGLGINTVCATLWLIGDVIWVDFLHVNPYRTQSNALEMIALSPVYGIFASIFGSFLPILSGAAALKAGSLIYHRPPAWLFVLIAPICGLAAWIQASCILDEGRDYPLWDNATGLVAMQVPFLLTCWWWSRRRRKLTP